MAETSRVAGSECPASRIQHRETGGLLRRQEALLESF